MCRGVISYQFKKNLHVNFILQILVINLVLLHPVSAATEIDLRYQKPNNFDRYLSTKIKPDKNLSKLKQISIHVDFNHVAHMRYQQIYAGLPVWNASSILHVPETSVKNINKSSMNGILYDGLENDLPNKPPCLLDQKNQIKALQKSKIIYEKKTHLKGMTYQQESVKAIIYVDEKKQAHYAYLISFFVDHNKTGIHQPTMIMDATSFYMYQSWDQVMTFDTINAGGIGGNKKIGELIYDGDRGHLPWLKVYYYKDGNDNVCFLKNDTIVIKDVSLDSLEVTQKCLVRAGKHNNVAWLDWDENETRWKGDEVNQGYSPSIDAFYGATIVSQLYQDWYGIPVLVEEDGKTPMKIDVRVHYGRNVDNAMFVIDRVYLADGGEKFYPFTSLDVIAHELSHGFTLQHSLIGYPLGQMTALNESFSDMTSSTL